MTILAIDPGPTKSAWVRYKDGQVLSFAHEENASSARGSISAFCAITDAPLVVIERVRGYGMVAGNEIYETCEWVGRFAEIAQPVPVLLITRAEVKEAVCGNRRGTDAMIRAALLDRYGGKDAALGTRKQPGPLRGIAGDVWAALAVAVAAEIQLKGEGK